MTDITLLDGSIGQEIVKRSGSRATPLWSTSVMMEQPEAVRAVHLDYFNAGATIATTNTYAVHVDRLARVGLEAQHKTLLDIAMAEAVAAHYRPLGPGDACPANPVAVAVALADKLDTLFWFFAVDEKPTGSKDPFALRRAALGAIRLVLENGLRLPLGDAFRVAAEGHAAPLPDGPAPVINELLDFFADRLKVHLKESGVRHDLVSAIFALGGEDDLVRLLARVDALRDFIYSEDGENLLTAYRRAANIVRIEEKKDGRTYDPRSVEGTALVQDEETVLLTALDAVEPEVATAVAEERYADAMAELSRLRRPVDAFFDGVTVNCDTPALRANRLGLLARIGQAMGTIADFSRIEG